MMLFIVSVIICLLVGIAAMMVAKRLQQKNYYGVPMIISGLEFVFNAVLIVIIAILVLVVVGPSAAQAQAADGYHQFFNGSVVAAKVTTYRCTRDGPCRHTYLCDPYQVAIHHPAVLNSKGEVVVPAYTTWETHYHDCPYATEEYNYYLNDNLGRTLVIGDHWVATSPQSYRGKPVPSSIARGVPARWLTSQRRLKSGDAEGVTMLNNYKNFILPASDNTFRQFSSSIETYQKRGLLPSHTANLKTGVLFDYNMQATKVQFMKVNPAQQATWQNRLMAFNAALGTQLQGDLHIVVVPASAVSNPTDYINALTAYWQSDFGKWDFPKNGIALAIGVDSANKTVVWSRAKTGMPIGNGTLLSALNNSLAGKPFNADTVLGHIKAAPTVDKKGQPDVRYVHSQGIVDQLMFTQYPFKRACMNCKDKTDHGTSYVYLEATIPVPFSAKLEMFLVVFVLSLALWGAAFYFDPIGAIRGTSNRTARPSFRSNNYPWR